MFPMKWTFKLEHIDEAGILRLTVVGLIERPERPRPSSSDDCKDATMRLLRPASCDQRSSAPAD
jgi:hypothetical protein